MLLITPSLIPAIRASASLADVMLGCFGVIFFSIVWRILALLRDSDHKSDRDMFGFCLLHLVKVCGHIHETSSNTFSLVVSLHYTSKCIMTSRRTVCLSHVHFLQAWLGLSCQVISEDKRSHPLFCNQCSPLYFPPIWDGAGIEESLLGLRGLNGERETWAINHSVTPA